MNIKLNITVKTIKHIEDNIRGKLYNIEFDSHLLDMTLKA